MPSSNSSEDEFELIHRDELRLTAAELHRIKVWLQPTDYEAKSSEFQLHLASQAPGTGRWVTETPTFRKWHDAQDQGSLWVKGPPGSGKSVMAAAIIDHLRTSEEAAVLFFFFRDIISTNRKPRSLTRDMLAQLLPYSISLQHRLLALAKKDRDSLSNTELWKLFLEGLSSIRKAYCFVDALDEIEQPADKQFLQRLNDFASFRPASVKLFVTSRPKQYLQSALSDTSILHINLQKDLVGRDIEAFVTYRLREFVSNDAARMPLASMITAKSQGLFLYARLLLEQLIEAWPQLRGTDPESWTESLPVGLAQMYDDILWKRAKTVANGPRVQEFILQLITHSRRPCRLSEIAAVLRHEFPELENPKEVARTVCSPLLEILEDETVQIIHHSLTEFLLASEQEHVSVASSHIRFTPVLSPLQVHRRVALACIDYLMSDALLTTEITRHATPKGSRCNCSQNICGSVEHQLQMYDEYAAYSHYPFLLYAMKSWIHHCAHYNINDKDFLDKVKEYLESRQFRTWVSIMWKDYEDNEGPESGKLSAIHVAAYGGLTEFARYILEHEEEEIDVDVEDEQNRTPLWWAARNGCTGMVALLLEHDACPKVTDYDGYTPLHEAVIHENTTIARMLLEAGADMLSDEVMYEDQLDGPEKIHDEHRPAGRAVHERQIAMIKTLIPFASDEAAAAMAFESCRIGDERILQMVLDDTPALGHAALQSQYLICVAVEAKSVECVELLLEHDVDINMKPDRDELLLNFWDGTSTSPLVALANGDNLNDPKAMKILQLLLDAGIDTEKDCAISQFLRAYRVDAKRAREIMNMFLEAGADINATDEDGVPIIHDYLRAFQDIEGVQMLLQRGADLSLDLGNASIWHNIFLDDTYGPKYSKNLDDVVAFLLEHGAGAVCHIVSEVPRGFGLNGLQMAVKSRSCSIESFAAMLVACSDAQARNKCLGTVGRWSSSGDQDRYLETLMSNGVSIETPDQNGVTPLLSHTGDRRVFQKLLGHGASPNAIDHQGRGLLHYFVARVIWDPRFVHEWLKQLDDLLALGLDPCCTDNRGFTLLHQAAKYYRDHSKERDSVIEALVDRGVSKNAVDDLGRTPLLVFLEEGLHITQDDVWSDENWKDKISNLWTISDINKQDTLGLSAFHHAAMNSEYCLAQLLASESDYSAETIDQENALHLACRARCVDTVNLLLRHPYTRYMANQRDKKGRTPLHHACRSGALELVTNLLHFGADTSARDSHGRTPLHACAEYRRERSIWNDIIPFGRRSKKERLRPGRTRDSRFYAEYDIGDPSQRPYNYHYQQPKNKIVAKPAYIEGVIAALCSSGVDLMAKDSLGMTPFEYASKLGCQTVVAALKPICGNSKAVNGLPTASEQTNIPKKRHPDSGKSSNAPPPMQVPDGNLSEDWRTVIGKDATAYLTAKIPRLKKIRGLGDEMRKIVEESVREGRLDLVERLHPLISLIYGTRDGSRSKEETTPVVVPDTPILFYACERKTSNMAMVEYLLDKCLIDPNVQQRTKTYLPSQGYVSVLGGTVLHQLAVADRYWHLIAIPKVVEYGAKLEAKNHHGETPLHVACSKKEKGVNDSYKRNWPHFWVRERVEILLELGADPCAVDKKGRSTASKINGVPKIMEIFIKRDAPIPANDWLLAAIDGSNPDAVKMALDRGANSNTVDDKCLISMTRGWNTEEKIAGMERLALFCACEKGDAAVVTLLIKHGASLLSPVRKGYPLLHYILSSATRKPNMAVIKFVSEAHLELKDHNERTLLLAASDNGAAREFDGNGFEPIESLISLGANVFATDNKNRNFLHHMIDAGELWRSHKQIMRILDHEFCKTLVSQQDDLGDTPLHYLLRLSYWKAKEVCEIFEKMVSLGADVRQPDSQGRLAFHHIASNYLHSKDFGGKAHPHDEKSIVRRYKSCNALWQRLLDAGCSIDARDNCGDPPLFYYLRSNRAPSLARDDKKKTIHQLRYDDLLADADPFIRNAKGETALHVVAKRPHGYDDYWKAEKMLFKFMADKGIDPLAEDLQDQSSLDAASALGKSHILKLYQYNS